LTIYQLGASVFHASILNYYILVADAWFTVASASRGGVCCC